VTTGSNIWLRRREDKRADAQRAQDRQLKWGDQRFAAYDAFRSNCHEATRLLSAAALEKHHHGEAAAAKLIEEARAQLTAARVQRYRLQVLLPKSAASAEQMLEGINKLEQYAVFTDYYPASADPERSEDEWHVQWRVVRLASRSFVSSVIRELSSIFQ
jgi:hypothetical protein